MVAVLDVDVIGRLLDQAFETRNQRRVAVLLKGPRIGQLQFQKNLPFGRPALA